MASDLLCACLRPLIGECPRCGDREMPLTLDRLADVVAAGMRRHANGERELMAVPIARVGKAREETGR